jgi:hypothetical protein
MLAGIPTLDHEIKVRILASQPSNLPLFPLIILTFALFSF